MRWTAIAPLLALTLTAPINSQEVPKEYEKFFATPSKHAAVRGVGPGFALIVVVDKYPNLSGYETLTPAKYEVIHRPRGMKWANRAKKRRIPTRMRRGNRFVIDISFRCGEDRRGAPRAPPADNQTMLRGRPIPVEAVVLRAYTFSPGQT